MILELADILIQPGRRHDFEAAIREGVETVIAKAHGFLGYSVQRGLENPERYLLQIRWASLEDHTLGFRGSLAFSEWRGIVGPFFARAPIVEHFTFVAGSDAA